MLSTNNNVFLKYKYYIFSALLAIIIGIEAYNYFKGNTVDEIAFCIATVLLIFNIRKVLTRA